MQSFKESGAREYSSDVLLGLQLKDVGSQGFNVDEAKKKEPREIELVILKNRNGQQALFYHLTIIRSLITSWKWKKNQRKQKKEGAKLC